MLRSIGHVLGELRVNIRICRTFINRGLHMQAAVDECATDPNIHAQLTEYMTNAAQHMINR